jgi:hypothetical protein
VTPTRVRSLAGLALASTVLLSGCGGAVPSFNPGLAARVGDQTITSHDVDDVAESYCGAAEQQLQEGQVLPQHYLRGEVAGGLALRAAADQLLDEYGVAADDQYDQAVAQARSQEAIKALPADQQDALIDVQGAALYVQAAELAVGRAILEKQGRTPKDKAAQAVGVKAFQAWLDDHDVQINPQYGVSIDKGQTAVADTSLSYALGDTATKADAQQPDTTYAAGLPDTQRCG